MSNNDTRAGFTLAELIIVVLVLVAIGFGVRGCMFKPKPDNESPSQQSTAMKSEPETGGNAAVQNAPATSKQATPNEVNQQILAELQKQNALLRQELDERVAADAWKAEREKYFQKWSDMSAQTKERFDKLRFEQEKREAQTQSAIDALSGNARIGKIRVWRPTYGEWYSQYLAEYRKVCGEMSRDELRKFAADNGLSW